MKTLVTGSSGFLGEALMIRMRELGMDVVGTDILAGPQTDIVGDLQERSVVEKAMEGISAVIHAATLHKPHIVTHSKKDFVGTNITGTLHLLEESVRLGVSAFLYTSTTSTFGDAMAPGPGEPAVLVTEELVPRSKNIYGVTKLAAEDLCQIFHRNHGLPCLILRTSRFFREVDDNPSLRGKYEDANIKVNELLYRRVDIEDVVTSHLLALERAASIGFSKYIISASSPFQLDDLPRLAQDMPAIVRKYAPSFPELYEQLNWQMFPTISRVYVNDKARRELGWEPKYDFFSALTALAQGLPYQSPLSFQVEPKRYHDEEFEDGPYPVK